MAKRVGGKKEGLNIYLLSIIYKYFFPIQYDFGFPILIIYLSRLFNSQKQNDHNDYRLIALL